MPKATGGYLGLRHSWTADFRSNVVYSFLDMSNPAGSTLTLDKRLQSAHVNVIWAIAQQVELGLEYLHARRELASAASGKLNRIIAMAKVAF